MAGNLMKDIQGLISVINLLLHLLSRSQKQNQCANTKNILKGDERRLTEPRVKKYFIGFDSKAIL